MRGITALPGPARFLVSALRAAAADRACGATWDEGELIALCDAVGLRRDAAARIGACLVLLLRESRPAPCLRPFGCGGVAADELALLAAFAAMQEGRPWQAQRAVAVRLPPNRRVQGVAMLALAARDLAEAGLALGSCDGAGS
jgi:hypothetical protein